MQSSKEDQAFRDFQGTESDTSKAEIFEILTVFTGPPLSD